jgi:hypothetical protein
MASYCAFFLLFELLLNISKNCIILESEKGDIALSPLSFISYYGCGCGRND